MKITFKLMILTAAALFVFGCSKKEKPTPPAPQTPPAEKAVETPTPPVEQTVVPAPQPVQPAQPVQPQTPAGPVIPEMAIELKTAAPLKGLEWVKGGPVTLEPGKIYLVEFWATWCGPCKVTIPHLTELQNKYKDKNLTVIGISNEDPGTIKRFMEKMGDQMGYAVAADTQGLMDKNYMQAFNESGIPHAFLIDGNGKIIWHGHPLEDLDTVLAQVVKGDFDPAAYAKQKAQAQALQQQTMKWYTDYFQGLENGDLNDPLRKIGAQFIEAAPVDGLNAFAWNILTRVKQQNRDLDAALKAAQKANQLSEGKDPLVLDTYAMALFQNGKVAEAVQAEQQAVDLLKDNPPVQEQLRQKLETYKAAAEKKAAN